MRNLLISQDLKDEQRLVTGGERTAFQIRQLREKLWNWKAWEKPETGVTETK